MHHLNQKGAIHLFLTLILIIGIVVGVYLVQQTQIFKPKAGGGSIPDSTTAAVGIDLEWTNFDAYVGQETAFTVTARSDFDSANLFVAKLKFDPSLIKITKIEGETGFIKNWIEQNYDNATGEVSLIGGVPNPGVQTTIGSSGHMATIYFVPLKVGALSILLTGDTAIYRNSDNANVIGYQGRADIAIRDKNTVGTKNVGVMILEYYPLDSSGTRLDPNIAGTAEELSSMRNRVSGYNQQALQKLTDATKYHGYKNTSSPPAISYSLVEKKEFLTALPVSTNRIPWNSNAYRPDYNKILTDLDICDYVNNKNVKQVWLWGYHHGNIEPVESNMSMGTSSKSFWNFSNYGDISNSEKINDLPICNNTYVLYNYNFTRGLGEVLEDHGHHLESVMSFVDANLWWNKFARPHGLTNTTINRCGWTHSPPNVTDAEAYNWSSERIVKSDCEDWKPDGGGEVKDVSCHTWYGQNCINNGGVEFKIWWMQNMPGLNNDLTYQGQKLRNWWEFYADFDLALAQGKTLLVSNTPAPIPPIPTASPTSSPTPSASPTTNSGDGNGDGKVNLVDLSILFTDFNKTTGFRTGIDLNGDGKINVFDFSAMRSLLIQKGVVRGYSLGAL